MARRPSPGRRSWARSRAPSCTPRWSTEQPEWSSPCADGPFAVMGFTVAEGKIVEIDAIADPERVRRIAAAVLRRRPQHLIR